MDMCSLHFAVKSEENMDGETADEANNLLRNGILVETSKGLICMSLSDALSSDLNLSVDDLRNVAAQLISQQNITGSRDRLVPASINCDSDAASIKTEIKIENVGETLKQTEIKIENVDETPDQTLLPAKNIEVNKPKKGRGGWPKGRKRKPELLNLPPKAPATGYNLYLNEQRKLFKDSSLAFHEITKIIGNRWSSLTLDGKKPYLEKAEEDKKRYREELKQYRQSDAYRAYLSKKRKKRLQNNILSESDMDATDDFDSKSSTFELYNNNNIYTLIQASEEPHSSCTRKGWLLLFAITPWERFKFILVTHLLYSPEKTQKTQNITNSRAGEEEDNEELYCRTCDQWFHNLHNKREHLQGKQHLQSVAGDITRELGSDIDGVGTTSTFSISTSLDESSLDGMPNIKKFL
ncbi:hypothetical protein NQ317_006760 [Molorchus minor]|uniref:HMG box domain-containing protein n=1 Tax=Molorchus minor TaxID=1323400 RepID=A0ABQ9JMI5_9CUCU|nr:hypothetical protein NQ317_006760 [Molorchus minor]